MNKLKLIVIPTIILLSTAICLTHVSAAPIKSDESILFIIDYSGSMAGEHIATVRSTMQKILPQIPKTQKVGLRLYGHEKYTFNPQCKSTTLVTPIMAGNGPSVWQGLFAYEPKSNSEPIAYSLGQAVDFDFRGINTKKHIILFSDGGNNCGESPCEYARRLQQMGRTDVIIDIISYDTAGTFAEFACTAETTGGNYYKADNEHELINVFTQALKLPTTTQKLPAPTTVIQETQPLRIYSKTSL